MNWNLYWLISFHDPSIAYTHIRTICMCVYLINHITPLWDSFLCSYYHVHTFTPYFLSWLFRIQNDWGQIAKSISRNTSIILLFHLTLSQIIPMKKRDLDLAWTILRLEKCTVTIRKVKFYFIYFFPSNFTEVLLTVKL